MPKLNRDELLPLVPLSRLSDQTATGVTFQVTPGMSIRYESPGGLVEAQRTATHVRFLLQDPVTWTRL